MNEKQVFGVAVRILGLWFVVQGAIRLLMLLMYSHETISIYAALDSLIYVGVGLFLLQSPKKVVDWVYRNKRD